MRIFTDTGGKKYALDQWFGTSILWIADRQEMLRRSVTLANEHITMRAYAHAVAL
jgi:hypothetical protein